MKKNEEKFLILTENIALSKVQSMTKRKVFCNVLFRNKFIVMQMFAIKLRCFRSVEI